MGIFVNSFEIAVPTLPAEVYDIDPQPSEDDPWRALDSYETAVEWACRGSSHRVRVDDDRAILSIAATDSQEEGKGPDGTRLVRIEETSVGGENDRYQSAVKQALRNSLEWFVTNHLNFWERGNSQAFYEWTPSNTVGMYDAYHGYKATIDYTEGYYLTVDSTVKFIASQSSGEFLSDIGREEVEKRFFTRYCTLMSDSRPSVELISLADDLTVSDKTMMIGGEEQSVLEYIEVDDKYPQEAIDSRGYGNHRGEEYARADAHCPTDTGTRTRNRAQTDQAAGERAIHLCCCGRSQREFRRAAHGDGADLFRRIRIVARPAVRPRERLHGRVRSGRHRSD